MAKSFTPEEREILESSPYVKRVGDNQLSYKKEYYYQLYLMMEEGFELEEALENVGTPITILGDARAQMIKHRAYRRAKEGKLLPPKPVKEPSTESTAVKRVLELEEEVERLKQENEFLKKKRLLDRR